MIEIRVHARAGQGAITTAEILGNAYFKAGKYSYAFPHFGAARMGAAMNAFIRIDDRPIRMRSRIYEPDYIIVIDATLMRASNVFEGMKENGIALINGGEKYLSDKKLHVKVYHIPANEIALKIIGRPLGNTALLGALVALLDDLTLQNLKDAIKERFQTDLAEKNIKCAEEGYNYLKKEAE